MNRNGDLSTDENRAAERRALGIPESRAASRQPRPEQQIDLTGRGDQLRYVEILTDGGTVRVNVNLVDVRTNAPTVVVEVEPALGWDALPGHNSLRAEVRLQARP